METKEQKNKTNKGCAKYKELSFVKVQLVREEQEVYKELPVIRNPQDAAGVACHLLHLDQEAQEVFTVLMLNTKGKINAVSEITRGTVSESIVHPREVFKAAILHNAGRIICVHNHPTGFVEPSDQDIIATYRLIRAGKLLQIPVQDHIIIGTDAEDFYSFADHGRMDENTLASDIRAISRSRYDC